MKKKNCDLCQRRNLRKDTFLFENGYCFLCLNSGPIFKVRGKKLEAKKRFTIVVQNHLKRPSPYLLRMAKETSKEFLRRKYSLFWKKDYNFYVTLGTYPKHWHMHACVYPYKEVKEKRLIKK